MRFSCDQCSRFLRRGFVKSPSRASPTSARPRPRSTLTATVNLTSETVFGARTSKLPAVTGCSAVAFVSASVGGS